MDDIEALVRAISRRLEGAGGKVLAFWLNTPQDRRRVAERIKECRGDIPIVPLIVRGVRFQSAHSLLDDLAELVGASRSLFDGLAAGRDFRLDRCAIVLLAHTDLELPQISSPALMPDWFPIGDGRELAISIEDLSWKLEGPLGPAALRNEEIAGLLLSLETVMLDRLERARDRDPRLVDGFFSMIRREKEPFSDFIAAARVEVSKSRADNFRPTAKNPRSLTARIWLLVRSSSPDQLEGKAERLAQALGLESFSGAPYESLFAVLARPTQPSGDAAVRCCRNALVAIFTACQLSTASHHGADYEEYPLPLMRTVAYDIARALRSIEEHLTLSPTVQP